MEAMARGRLGHGDRGMRRCGWVGGRWSGLEGGGRCTWGVRKKGKGCERPGRGHVCTLPGTWLKYKDLEGGGWAGRGSTSAMAITQGLPWSVSRGMTKSVDQRH